MCGLPHVIAIGNGCERIAWLDSIVERKVGRKEGVEGLRALAVVRFMSGVHV